MRNALGAEEAQAAAWPVGFYGAYIMFDPERTNFSQRIDSARNPSGVALARPDFRGSDAPTLPLLNRYAARHFRNLYQDRRVAPLGIQVVA